MTNLRYTIRQAEESRWNCDRVYEITYASGRTDRVIYFYGFAHFMPMTCKSLSNMAVKALAKFCGFNAENTAKAVKEARFDEQIYFGNVGAIGRHLYKQNRWEKI